MRSELEEGSAWGRERASTAPELIWPADARSRPASTARKFHLIYRFHVTFEVRA